MNVIFQPPHTPNVENSFVLFGVGTCIITVWKTHRNFPTSYLMKKHPFFERCIFLGMIFAGTVVLVWIFTHGVPYFCPIRWGLGIECPACGMTRAADALLHFQFQQAWHTHPLVFVSVFYAGILAVFWLIGKQKWMHAKWLWIPFIVLFLVWWVVKAVAFLNGSYPSFYEPRAVIPRLVRLIGQFL